MKQKMVGENWKITAGKIEMLTIRDSHGVMHRPVLIKRERPFTFHPGHMNPENDKD